VRRPLLPLYVALSLIDAAVAQAGWRGVRRFTKPLLMPVLMADVVAAEGEQADKRVLAGLGLSWAGDVALMKPGDAAFGAGLGSFLAAHFCYLAAFRSRREGRPVGGLPLKLVYGAAWVALNALLLPRAGKLRVPVFVYGATLAAMAAAAADTGSPAVAAGGAAFLISDSVLALNKFDAADIPAAGAVVMLTYTAAQALIATR
jgi:uncharacterized membrane protein YhhN